MEYWNVGIVEWWKRFLENEVLYHFFALTNIPVFHPSIIP